MQSWAAVVDQLAELLLPTTEVCSLNPVIRKIYIGHLFTTDCIEKTKTWSSLVEEDEQLDWPKSQTTL